jgi:hypothetical protein
MPHERTDNQNQRIARSIILSNTNPTQRDSLLWLADIERAIVKALNAKAAEAEKSEDALRFSQAACNAANAMCSLASEKTIKVEK